MYDFMGFHGTWWFDDIDFPGYPSNDSCWLGYLQPTGWVELLMDINGYWWLILLLLLLTIGCQLCIIMIIIIILLMVINGWWLLLLMIYGQPPARKLRFICYVYGTSLANQHVFCGPKIDHEQQY